MKCSHACDHCTIDPCYFLIQGIGNQQSSFHPSVPKGDYHLSISTLGGRENYHPLERITASHNAEGLSSLTILRDYHSEEGLAPLTTLGDYNSDRGLCPSLP